MTELAAMSHVVPHIKVWVRHMCRSEVYAVMLQSILCYAALQEQEGSCYAELSGLAR